MTATAAIQPADTGDVQVHWQQYWQQPTEHLKCQLVSGYTDYAHRIALRVWRRAGLPDSDRDDCLQIAVEALLEAIDQYQPGYQARFETYASKRIYGAVIDGIRHNSEQASYYHYQQQLKRERRRAVSQSQTRAETLDELIAMTLDLALVHLLEHEHQRLEKTESPFYNVQESERLQDEFTNLLDRLTPTEQAVMKRHYQQDKAFADIARELAISRARVSQLHASSLKKLRALTVTDTQQSPGQIAL